MAQLTDHIVFRNTSLSDLELVCRKLMLKFGETFLGTPIASRDCW